MVRQCGYLIREAEPAEWQDMLREFPSHSVFHTLPWLETIRSVHGAQVRLMCAQTDTDGRCAAVWPVLTTRKGPLRVAGSPLPSWSTAYLGPLFNCNGDVNRVLDTFLKHELFRKSAYFACKVLNTGVPVDLSPHGFESVLEFETYCLDLTLPRETLWTNLKSECRTRIRKAEKLGITVRSEKTAEFIDEYWTMTIETFTYQQMQPPFPRQFVEELWKRLREGGRIRVLSAIMDGRRIATLVLPFDEHTMYYWAGASYGKYRGIPAHNLLHWEAICLAQDLGLQRYDFISTLGGAGRFKKTFGPQTVTMATHWERCSSRLVKVLKDGYEQYLMRRQRISAIAPLCGSLLQFAA